MSDEATATVHEREERLQEREAELREGLRRPYERFHELKAAAETALADGDEERAAELREERLRVRAEMEDRVAALERVREEREELRPALLQAEVEKAVAVVDAELEAAREHMTALARELNLLATEHDAPARQAYGRAVEAGSRAQRAHRELHELDPEMAANVAVPSGLNRSLREAAPRGWDALAALEDFRDRKGRGPRW